MWISLPGREQTYRMPRVWLSASLWLEGGKRLERLQNARCWQQEIPRRSPSNNRHIQQILAQAHCLPLRRIPGRSVKPGFRQRNSGCEGASIGVVGTRRQWRILQCLGGREEYLHRLDKSDQGGRRYNLKPLPSGAKQNHRARRSRLCILVRNTCTNCTLCQIGRVSAQAPGGKQSNDNGAATNISYVCGYCYCWQGDQE